MTEDELEEYNTTLGIYAGVALLALLLRNTAVPADVTVRDAFDIAEETIKELEKRKK